MSPRTPFKAAVIGSVFVAALLLTGCTSDSASNADEPTAAQTAMTDAGTDTAQSAAPEAEGTCTAVLADPADDSVQVTISADGFSPATISVPVGGSVTFTAGDDGPHSAQVGTLDAASVMGGLVETFRFDAAGECAVWDEISEMSAIITVE